MNVARHGPERQEESWLAAGRHIVKQLRAAGLLERGELVLDYGCGLGRITEILLAGGHLVTALELVPERVAYVRQRLEGMVRTGRLELHEAGDPAAVRGELAARGPHEVALLLYVLQHNPLETAQAIVAELALQLAPGGALVFSYPTKVRGPNYVSALDDPHATEAPSCGVSRILEPHEIPRLLERAPCLGPPEPVPGLTDVWIARRRIDLEADVAWTIKTFERPDLARRLIRSVRDRYPAARIYVADDSKAPSLYEGCRTITLPVDAGLSAGRNALVQAAAEPFVLLLDDDFVVAPESHLERFARLLERTGADVVCGSTRLGGRAVESYEGRFRIDGDTLHLEHLDRQTLRWFHGHDWSAQAAPVDYALNFFLARTTALKACPWDARLKLGEHVEWFLAARDARLRVWFTPDVVIDHMRPTTIDPEYARRRRRAVGYIGDALERRGLRRMINLEKATIERRPRGQTVVIPP